PFREVSFQMVAGDLLELETAKSDKDGLQKLFIPPHRSQGSRSFQPRVEILRHELREEKLDRRFIPVLSAPDFLQNGDASFFRLRFGNRPESDRVIAMAVPTHN